MPGAFLCSDCFPVGDILNDGSLIFGLKTSGMRCSIMADKVCPDAESCTKTNSPPKVQLFSHNPQKHSLSVELGISDINSTSVSGNVVSVHLDSPMDCRRGAAGERVLSFVHYLGGLEKC